MALAVQPNPNAKKVFVISPIGAADSPVRKQADRFLNYIVRRALPYPDFAVERADEHDSPLAITAAMLHSIMEADICVADISGRNPNVMYELAIAHAMDKHVVIMDSDSGPSPFDIQDMRAIPYGLFPEEVEMAVHHLRQKATHQPGPNAFADMMNPVAVAFRKWTERQKAEVSGTSSEQVLVRMMERLEEKVERVGRQSKQEEPPTVFDFDQREGKRALQGHAQQMVGDLMHLSSTGRLDPSHFSLIERGEEALAEAEVTGQPTSLLRWVMESQAVLQAVEGGEPGQGSVERTNP